MFEFNYKPDLSKKEFYKELSENLRALIHGGRNWVTNFANASSLLYYGLNSLDVFKHKGINWVGFYMADPVDFEHLYLGPFQGKVASTRIKFGHGVLGTVAVGRKTRIVEILHESPGHIARDTTTGSEIVVPIMEVGGSLVTGVLAIDSQAVETFDKDDEDGLEEFVHILAHGSDSPLLSHSQ